MPKRTGSRARKPVRRTTRALRSTIDIQGGPLVPRPSSIVSAVARTLANKSTRSVGTAPRPRVPQATTLSGLVIPGQYAANSVRQSMKTRKTKAPMKRTARKAVAQ